ncbi:MAG: GGDEF domain-containing protein [Lachnospiraceae bacterium]|nr:GGDEF domain-containing protein [Lachnospiraceae bacterium]
MVKELVGINYATVVTVFCLLVFIITNDYFNKRIRVLYLISCVMVLCLVTVDSIEYWTATFDTLSPLRIWMSAIGYSIRPAIVFVVILLLLEKQNDKRIFWFALPLIINTMIAFSALFTDIAYSYTVDNQFVRGPIGYFAFVTTGFYEIMLIVCTVKMNRSVRISETVISVAVVIIFLLATVLESVWKYEGVINTSGAIAMTFYYLYLNSQQFKRDPLTNVLNRRCFFLDYEKNEANISALISLDLNDLKKWNDKYGHAKGDEAISTIVHCIESVIPKNCFLYRIGGDEFMILCFGQKRNDTEQLVKQMKEKIAKTPFSCAIGVVYQDGDMDCNEMCLQADKAMYEDKIKMKGLK